MAVTAGGDKYSQALGAKRQAVLVLHLCSCFLCLLLGLLLLSNLLLFFQRCHNLSHLAGGDLNVFFVHQVDYLRIQEGDF